MSLRSDDGSPTYSVAQELTAEQRRSVRLVLIQEGLLNPNAPDIASANASALLAYQRNHAVDGLQQTGFPDINTLSYMQRTHPDSFAQQVQIPPGSREPAPATPEQNHAAYLARLAQEPMHTETTLRRGMRNPAVGKMQERLLALDIDIGPKGTDGDFGGHSRDGLIHFQNGWHKNHSDFRFTPGVADPATLEALNMAIREKAQTATQAATLHPPEARPVTTGQVPAAGQLGHYVPPLDQVHFTSGRCERIDPLNPDQKQFHPGYDMRGAAGTPVKAIMDGKVEKIYDDPQGGRTVVLDLADGNRAIYCHLANDTPVKPGDRVKAGQQIAQIGPYDPAISTGTHLYLAVKKPNGESIDWACNMTPEVQKDAARINRHDEAIVAARLALSQPASATIARPLDTPDRRRYGQTPDFHG